MISPKVPVVIVVVVLVIVIVISFFYDSEKKEISNPPIKIRVVDCPSGVIMDTPNGEQCLLSETLSTPGMKTYANNKYGYEIKYPGNFDIIPAGDPDTLLLRSTSDYEKDTDLTFAGLSIDTNTSVSDCKNELIQPVRDSAMGGVRGKYFMHPIIANNLCYMIRYDFVYRDLHGFQDPPYPPHFDEAKVLADLREIVGSFEFINRTAIVVPVSTTTETISQ